MQNNLLSIDNLALGMEAMVRSELLKLINLVDDRPRLKWREAVARYRLETQNKDSANEASLFKYLDPILGDLYLDEIQRSHIDLVIRHRQVDGVCNTTINRYLQKIRAVLRRAHREWEVKCNPPTIKLLKEPKIRVRWITPNQAKKLLATLPPHLRDMAIFALETGLRESNVTLLRWNQVDLNRKVVAIEGDDILKGDKPFIVPLSEKALEVLLRQRGNHAERVFTFKGKPIRRANGKAFRAALKRAEIDDFRWHDLRHTWATWHVQRGTPLEVLQELGGWTEYSMVKRYAHFTHEHLHKFVNNNNLHNMMVLN
jgi:integrase